MKNKIYNLAKCLLAIIIVVGSFSNSMAQGVKVDYLEELKGFYVNRMSANGRFIVLGMGGTDYDNTAAVWDRETGKTVVIGMPCTAHDASNDGIIVGKFLDPATDVDGRVKISGGWWKDGKWTSLGGHPNHPITKFNGSSAVAISPDGQYIGGHVSVGPRKIVPCVWKWNSETKKYDFHKEYSTFPESAQGARPWDMSDDGQILAGWDSMATNRSWWTPSMWTDTDVCIKPGIPHADYGEATGILHGINPEGTIAVGESTSETGGAQGLILHVDGTYKLIPATIFVSMSSTGMVVGTDGVWTEEIGRWRMSEYLRVFWGVEASGVDGRAMSISNDGKYIAGWNMAGGIPYTITLDGEIMPIPPKGVSTLLDVAQKSIAITWEEPYSNGETILGYNIYRESEKLNSSIITGLTFTDTNPKLGMNSYTVVAIYQYASGMKESVKSEASSIEMIAEDGCFSPKKLAIKVKYNKTVTLTWGLPLPNYASGEVRTGAEELKGYNVYKNGVKTETLDEATCIFVEDITIPADYTYTVTALFGNDCESSHSLPQTITINPIGVCNAPKNIKIELIRNTAQITWSKPAATAPHKVLGYDLYRNGVKLNNELLKNEFYTDTELAIGEYSYQLEAAYDNSCVSNKSTAVVASIGGVNTVSPPTKLAVNMKDNTEAILSWNTPALGEYATMKWYNGGIEWHVGEKNEPLLYIASKWDATDLELYFDYTLTDIEFYPTVNIPHTFYVYIDGVPVVEQHLATVIPNSFNLLKLDKPVLIEKGKELMVGYKIVADKDVQPIGADKKASKNGKGDLVSYDGKTYKSLYNDYKVAANWAITIRLSPYSVEPAQAMSEIEFESCKEGELTFIENLSKSNEQSIFINKEVVGYEVYKDNVKVDAVEEPSCKITVDNASNSCYSVVALYTNDRKSSKSNTECVYGECNKVNELKASATNSSVDLSWTEPTGDIVETVEVKYHNGETTSFIGFVQLLTYYTLIQVTPLEFADHDNLKLKSIEALIRDQCDVSLIVAQDGKIVIEKVLSGINFGEYNTFEIPDDGLNIDVKKNILVGFKIKSNPNKLTVGLDGCDPSNSYRGDILSMDLNLNTFTTVALGSGGILKGNWNISANFEEITKTDEEVKEYNIYRNGVKFETTASTTFKDETVEENKEYEYYVTTLWNTGCESKESNKVKVHTRIDGVNDIDEGDIVVFPNPANNRVSIRGEYSSLKIYNNIGILVLEQNQKSNSINIEHLQGGLYIVELSNESEVINRTKLVITR